MIWPVLGGIFLVWITLGLLRANLAVWAGSMALGFYVWMRWGFAIPMPASVRGLYMGILLAALAAYVSTDAQRWRAFSEPILRLLVDRAYGKRLLVCVLAVPLWVGADVYVRSSQPVQPPVFGRTVHPSPPDRITAWNKTFKLDALDNPLRALETEDPEAFALHVKEGRRVYYQNCFYCHGDVLKGRGPLVHALDPIPANLADAGTIDQFQEAFLFWRIVKGGPGLPDEGGPWMSSMPAWEKFLSEEEVWSVILFMYDFSGLRPRAREEIHH